MIEQTVSERIAAREHECELLEQSILASYDLMREYDASGLNEAAKELHKKIRKAERDLADMKQEIYDARKSLML